MSSDEPPSKVMKKMPELANELRVVQNPSDEAQATQSSSASTTKSAPFESRFLGEYTIQAVVGHGEFGVVFKARHKIDKRWYAIKQVDPAGTEQSLDKVLREVRALAELDHPHIVRYYDAWLEMPPPGEELRWMDSNQPCLYIRMEWCSGLTLHEWLGQNRLPEQRPTKQTLGWFNQLVSAVKYIHDKKLIHRDIKPENIFFGSSRDGAAPVLKIGGFGLTTYAAASSSSGVSGGVSKSLSIVGTPIYMSPELLSGHYKNSTDIFSLGLVFLEMVHPFKTDRERHAVFWALRMKQRPAVMNKLDKKMGALISWMTAFEPEKRPTANQLDNELRKLSSTPETNFTDLPPKLMLKIFGYLYEGDLAQCALVSHKFRAIANDQILWKSLYQEVFEYSLPLLHVGHARFEFREPHDWSQPRSDESIIVDPWKESFKQLKDGIHVRPGYASLYSGFGAGGRRLTQCDRLDQALRLVKARGKNAKKLIFLHTGLYILETTVTINSDIQIIGASADPDIASRVIIEERLDMTVVLAEGSQDAYLGWMTVRSVSDFGAVAAAIDAENQPMHTYYCALQICDDSTALVEHCVIHSSATVGAAVYVHGSAANPTIRHCVVCDCEGTGICVADAARGQFEDCEIARNNGPGVWVGNRANPFFRRCHIHDGRGDGVSTRNHGMGYFESCNIHNNRLAGVEVKNTANPTVTRCEVHHGQSCGIRVHEKGRGQFMENRIHSNELDSIVIESHSDPKITRNKIWSNQNGGVLIRNNGQGVLEDNEIFDNAMAGVWIYTDGNPVLRHNKIYNGCSVGVRISHKGRGVLEDNDIYRNAQAGVLILSESNPTLRRNRVYEGRAAGIEIGRGAIATLESNAIFHNRFGGLCLATDVQPTLRDNKIYDNDDLVEKTVAKGGCLFEISSRTSPLMHDIYRCDTCKTAEEDTICLNCIRTCHAGHTVHLVCCGRFFCHCGAGMLKHQCKLQSKAQATQSSSTSATESAPFEGESISDYTIQRKIGHGGFGVVYKAQHNWDKQLYAIKKVDVARTEWPVEKVMREARIMRELSHQNIVKYYNAWQEGPPPGEELSSMGSNLHYLYIRMELCCDQTLRTWLRQNQRPDQRPISQTHDWFRQLVSAVKCIHDKGLIHRDINPGNIFFGSSRDGAASALKIGDFGLAIDMALSSSSGVSGGVSESLSLSIVGTPNYMSSEQLSGHYKNSADIFSLGLVFLEIVHPFKTDVDRHAVFWSFRSMQRPAVMNNLDKKMDALISWMTAFEPKKRATASELDNELKKMTDKELREEPPPLAVISQPVSDNRQPCPSFDALLKDGTLTDVTLVVGDRQMPAHRNVLSARSDYFKTLFTIDLAERRNKNIILKNTSLAAFQPILNYAYTGELDIEAMDEQMLLKVLELSHRYQFPWIQKVVAAHLAETITIDTVCERLNIAELLKMENLKKACLVPTLATELLRKRELASSLSHSALESALALNDLEVPEICRFQAVCGWIEKHRDEDAKSLLSNIRLSLLTVDDLYNIARPTNHYSKDDTA